VRIFWRLILPFVLACILAAVSIVGLIGSSSSRLPWGFRWWRPVNFYVLGALFIVFLVVSLWNALRWSKEAEEYAESLEDEEAGR
jgi:hypothetical protein